MKNPAVVLPPRFRLVHDPSGATRLVEVTPPAPEPRRFALVENPLRGPSLVQLSGERAGGFTVTIATERRVTVRETVGESFVLDDEGQWTIVAHEPRESVRERTVYGSVEVSCATAWRVEDVAWRAMNRPHGVGVVGDLCLPIARGDEGSVRPVAVVVRARELDGEEREVARLTLRDGTWVLVEGSPVGDALVRARASFEAARAKRDPAREARAAAADRAETARRVAAWARGEAAGDAPVEPSSLTVDLGEPPPDAPAASAVVEPQAPEASPPVGTIADRIRDVCEARSFSEGEWLRRARQPNNLFDSLRARAKRDASFAPPGKVLSALALSADVSVEWLCMGVGPRDVGLGACSGRSLGSDAPLAGTGTARRSRAATGATPTARAPGRRSRKAVASSDDAKDGGAL